jgi:hypothetical protein
MQSNNCNEFLSLVQKECNAITTQIDTFYKKDNQKENIESYFQEQIYDFRDKYANTYTMISDENNKNLGFDLG